jgi:hypothetical protein
MVKSLVDGGKFKHTNRETGEEFETDNIEEWKEYQESNNLTKTGSGSCPICNKAIDFNKVPLKLNPVHKECLEVFK